MKLFMAKLIVHDKTETVHDKIETVHDKTAPELPNVRPQN